jgi:hypothetical protein
VRYGRGPGDQYHKSGKNLKGKEIVHCWLVVRVYFKDLGDIDWLCSLLGICVKSED